MSLPYIKNSLINMKAKIEAEIDQLVIRIDKDSKSSCADTCIDAEAYHAKKCAECKCDAQKRLEIKQASDKKFQEFRDTHVVRNK